MATGARRELERLKRALIAMPQTSVGSRVEQAPSQQEDLARMYQALAPYKEAIRLATVSLMTRNNVAIQAPVSRDCP